MRTRALLAAAACAATLLAGVLPAGAHGGDADAESESGALEVAASPAVARVGHHVQVKAEYDPDDDDDAADELEDVEVEGDIDEADDEADDLDDDQLNAAAKRGGEDGGCVAAAGTKSGGDDLSEESESESDDDAGDCDEDDGKPDLEVAFTIDFGDGDGPVEMPGFMANHEHAKARARHVYDAEGDYTVTVTATPAGGTPLVSEVVVQVGRGIARLEGEDRIQTALRISRDSFADGEAGAVLLARSDAFADALASATLALAEEAPVLLIPSSELPDDVQAEIARVLAPGGTVYVLGGDAAIAPAVDEELAGLGYQVVRIAGDDRVATSVAIAELVVASGAEVDEVVLASATSFPDALSGAAYAADEAAPVLLTAPDALSQEVEDFLVALGTDVEVTVVGGTAGVSDALVDELLALGFAVERLAGDDRYDTSVEIARAGEDHPTVLIVATGATFPDALAGGVYAGRHGAPLVLVGDGLSDELRSYLEDVAGTIKVLVVLGGGAAVPQPVMEQIEAALGLDQPTA